MTHPVMMRRGGIVVLQPALKTTLEPGQQAHRDYRKWPKPIPSFSAFCLSDPFDLFISLAIFDTGVLALECCLSNFTSDAVYGLRAGFFALALAKFNPPEREYMYSTLATIIKRPWVVRPSLMLCAPFSGAALVTITS